MSDSLGSWSADHPVRAILLVCACEVAGGLLGVAASAVTTSVHLVSPDNVPAGIAMGCGGILLGAAAYFAVLARLGRRLRRAVADR